jgi:uncharacterized SAM-binding protein YcdF (DUF218 family)
MKNNNTRKIDVIVILGGGITAEGVLSSATKERLDKLLKTRDEMPLVPIIVSGCRSGFMKVAPSTTEAKEMKKYLVKHGIESRLIITESESLDTISNAIFTRRIVERHLNWKKILLITSNWHMERALWVFKKILGKGYQIVPLSVASGKKIKEQRKNYEKYLLNIAKGFLKNAQIDSKKLIGVLRTDHPFYSKSKKAQELLKAIAIHKEKISA